MVFLQVCSSFKGEMFENELLYVPEDRKLNDSDNESLQYFLFGDEIFSLKKWLMRPFPGKNATEDKKKTFTTTFKSTKSYGKSFWNFNCTLANLSKANSGNCC